MEGYDAKFDPPLDKRLECPICLLAQRDPLQTPCGHRFCASCILRALRETGPRCPVDNTRVSNHNLFRDNFAKREVLSLQVKCAAVDLGCKWKGELRNLESHMLSCDLVFIDCPNSCGHSCQRKDMSPHITSCSNKPEQCPTCSIHFIRDKVQHHLPHCSNIQLPESILSNLLKANELLKWTGHIKLKGNRRPLSFLSQFGNSPISCYLSAKMDTPESNMFCGAWLSQLNLSALDSQCAKVFMRTLQGPEVQIKTFTFNVLSNDCRGSLVSKMLKRKLNDISALLGLNLTSNMSRNDLTVMYIHWSDSKKKIVALVAELKAHLVKQMQSRLQSVQGSNSRRNRGGVPQHLPANRMHNPAYHMEYAAFHRHRQHSQAPPPAPVAGPPPPGSHHAPPPTGPAAAHMQHQPHHHHHHHRHPAHSHMHARQPALGIVAQGPPPPNNHSRQHQQQQNQHQQQAYHPLHSSQLFQENSAPRILSWPMSRSLSAYPWRVQHDNVPFFTFPSTPPSFLAANHYPYTFAPPISINQIAPGPAGPVPSYAGIAVPNVTGVDAVVSGQVGTTFPVAALTSLTEIPPEHLHNVPPGAVAVTIAGGNHPVTGQTVVIQQEPGMQNQDVAVFQAVPHQPPTQHPIHMHHGHAQYPSAQHIGPAIIARGDAGPPQPGPGVIQPGPSVIQHGPLVAAVPPPQLISVGGGPHHAGVMGVSIAHSVPPTSDHGHSWRDDGAAVNPPENQHLRPVGNSEHAAGPSSSQQYPPSLAQTGGESSGLAGPVRSRSSNNATITLISDEPGPSRINPDPDSPSDNSSDSDDSPGTQLSSMLYRRRHFTHYDNDSDDSSAVDLDSGDSLSYQHERQMSDLSGEGQLLTSDGDESSGLSDSESDEVTNPSTLRMINMNSAVVNVHPSVQAAGESSSSEGSVVNPSVYVLSERSPGNQVEEIEEAESPSDDDTVPPLITINLSSDPETPISQAETPPSIIDLTTSSANSSPILSDANNSNADVSNRRAVPAEDQRMYMDRVSRSARTNLFNGETSGEVVVVPTIRQQLHHHQQHSVAAAAATVDDHGNGANGFVMNAVPEMGPLMGVVATSQGREFHHGGHSVVQLTQPRAHQHYITLSSQQQQQPVADPSSQHTHPPPHMRQGHASRHSHAPPTNDQPPQAAAQQVFQFPQAAPHAAHAGEGVAIQQVSTLPPAGAAAAMESGPPSVNPHGVHVLTWQQRLPAGELVSGHALQPPAGVSVTSAVVLPPPAPQPTGQPMPEAVMAPHHHLQAEGAVAAVLSLQQPQQQATPPSANDSGAGATGGNFWETVMPSLDMSLQSNVPSASEPSTHH